MEQKSLSQGSQSTSFASHMGKPQMGSTILDRYRAKFDEPPSAAALSFAAASQSHSAGQRNTPLRPTGPSVRFSLGLGMEASDSSDLGFNVPFSTPSRGSSLVAMPRSPFEPNSTPIVSPVPVEGQSADRSGMAHTVKSGGIGRTAATPDAMDVRSQSGSNDQASTSFNLNSFSLISNPVGAEPPLTMDPDAEVAKVWLQRDTMKLSAFAILKTRLKEREEAVLEAKRKAVQQSVLGQNGLVPLHPPTSGSSIPKSPARQPTAEMPAYDDVPPRTQPRPELSHQLDLLISDLLIPEHLAPPTARMGSYSPPRGQRSFRYVMEHGQTTGDGLGSDDELQREKSATEPLQSASLASGAIPDSIRKLVRGYADYLGAVTDRAVARTAGSLHEFLQESRLPFGPKESRTLTHNGEAASAAPGLSRGSSFSDGGFSSGTDPTSTEDDEFGARSRSDGDSILQGSEARSSSTNTRGNNERHRSFRSKIKNRFAMQKFSRYLRRVEETVVYEFLALSCNYLKDDGTVQDSLPEEASPLAADSPLRSNKNEDSLPFAGVPTGEGTIPQEPADQQAKQLQQFRRKKRSGGAGSNTESLPCLVPETALNYYHRFSLSFSLSEYLSKWTTAEKIRFRLGIMLYRLECFRGWFLAEAMLDYVLGPKIGGRFGFGSVGVGSLTDLHDLLTSVHGKFGDFSLRSFHPLMRKSLLAVGACCKHHDEKLAQLRAHHSRTKHKGEAAGNAQAAAAAEKEDSLQGVDSTSFTPKSPQKVNESVASSAGTNSQAQAPPALSILKELQEQYCQRLCIACASSPWLPILSDYRSSSNFKHQLSDLPEADLHRHLALVQGKNPSVVGLWSRSRGKKKILPNGDALSHLQPSRGFPTATAQNGGGQGDERDWVQLAFGTTHDNRVAFTLAAENTCVTNLLRCHQALVAAQEDLRPIRRSKTASHHQQEQQHLPPDIRFRVEVAMEIATDASAVELSAEDARDQIRAYYLSCMGSAEMGQGRNGGEGASPQSANFVNCHPEAFWLHVLTEIVPWLHSRSREDATPGSSRSSRDPTVRLTIQQGVEVWKQANRCTLNLALFGTSFWSDPMSERQQTEGPTSFINVSPPRGGGGGGSGEDSVPATSSSLSPVRLERTKIPESLLGLREKEERNRFLDESNRQTANASIAVHALACFTAQMIREGLTQSDERHETPLQLHAYVARASLSATDPPYSELWPTNILPVDVSSPTIGAAEESVNQITSFIFGVLLSDLCGSEELSAGIADRGWLTGDDLLRFVSTWEQSSVSFVRFIQAVAPLTTVDGGALQVALTKRSHTSASSRATSKGSDSNRSSPTERALMRPSDSSAFKKQQPSASPDVKGLRAPTTPSSFHHREGGKRLHLDPAGAALHEDADDDEETLILLRGRALLLKYGIRRADSPSPRKGEV